MPNKYEYPSRSERPIKVSPDGALICPECNDEQLHQTNISEMVSHDRLVLGFFCEHCHGSYWCGESHDESDLFSLEIRQHKGTTFINWVM